MQSDTTHPLLFQRILRELARLGNAYRVPLISALLFGFLAHTFAFTNKLVNHDEVQCLFSKGATVVSGRWGLGALDSLFPNVSMPWIYGVITLVLLAISVCVLVSVLSIRIGWMQVLAAGLVLTFPSLTGTFGYLFTASSYGAAFLLAVLSVWLLQRSSRWYWLGAVVCMVLSLSIYQAYASLTAALLVLVLIRQLLEGEDAAAVFRRGVGYVLFLALSLGLYFGLTQLILKIKHVQMVSYAADSVTFDLRSLPDNIVLAYQNFVRNFCEPAFGLIPTVFSRRVHLLVLVCAAVLLVLQCVRMRKSPLSLLLLVALTAVLPLAVNCMYLFTAPDSIHTLVLYSFVCVYLLVLILADRALDRSAPQKWAEAVRRAALNGTVLLCAVIIAVNVYVANTSYLGLHLRYENAYAFYTALIADIRQSPEFTEGTKLAVIGSWEDPDFYEEHLDFTNYLTGVTGFKPDSYSAQRFLQYYLGFSIPFVSEEEAVDIAASAEFAEMPCYPYYGSTRKIGDAMVVKLS